MLPWVPVGLWLLLIFALGGAGFSSEQTSRFLGPFLEWLLPEWKPWEIRGLMFYIRKCAHVFEYGVTAILTFRAMDRMRPGISFWDAALPALGLVIVVAAADELRQSFLTVRSGEWLDVVLDTFGGLLGVAISPWLLAREDRLRERWGKKRGG